MKGLNLGPEDNNSSGRKRFLDDLPTFKPNYLYGPEASSQRWCSYQIAARFHLPHGGTSGYVLSHLGLKRKWLKDLDELEAWTSSSKRRRVGLAVKDAGDASSPSAAAPAAKAKAKPKAMNAKAKAKQQVDAERKACMNGLHFALKTWNDEEWLHDTELLCHLTDPEVKEHSAYLKDYKSPTDAMQYFSEMADGRYARVLCEMIGQLCKVKDLARCGFDCEPSAAPLDLESPDLLLEDARAHKAMDFLLTFMGQRVASCSWHSHSCPGLTAMLVSNVPATVTKGLAILEEMVKALEWTFTCGSAQGVKMAERSMLNGKLMMALVRLAKLTGFKDVNPPLETLLQHMWRGFLQSVMNERANQVLRDREIRRTTSEEELKRLKCWENVRSLHLFEDYGAKVEEVDCSIAVPKDLDLRIVFRAIGDDASVHLKRVMGEQDWQTWTSMTIRRSYAETQLMMDAYKANNAEYFARRPLRTTFFVAYSARRPLGTTIFV